MLKQLQKLLIFLLFFSLPLFAQEAQDPDQDVSVVIEESMVNKLLEAIGPVSGEGEADVKFSKMDYKWQVRHPSVEFEDGKAMFRADAKIKVSGVNYETPVRGHCDVTYDSEENKIYIQVKSAKFNLEFNVFGQKIKLGKVDVASFYSPKFNFDGPEPIKQDMVVDLPDGPKRFSIVSEKPQLYLTDGAIEVSSQVRVTELPLEVPEGTQP